MGSERGGSVPALQASNQTSAVALRCSPTLPCTTLHQWSGRECWAQQPQARPTFEEVVHRLRRLLEATPAS